MPADVQLSWNTDIGKILLVALSTTENDKTSLRSKQTELIQSGGVQLGELQTSDLGANQRSNLWFSFLKA